MKEHIIGISRRSFIATSASVAAVIACSGIISDPIEANAVTAAEKQAEASAALAKLNDIQKKLDIASADYYTALDEQETAQSNMDDAQRRIDETSARITEVQSQLGTRVRSMYRTGSTSFIDLLLGSSSYKAFTSNWTFLNDMNDSDSRMVQESKDLKATVEEEKRNYEEQERIAADKAAEAKQVQDEAQSLVAEAQATYDSLSSEAAELLEQERKAAEEEEARRAAAEASQREAEAAAANSGASNAAPGGGSSDSGNSPAQSNNSASGSNSGGGSGGSSSGSTNNNKSQTVPGSTVVERAYAHLGYPYAWGATGPNSFDCSGFVSMCLSGRYGYRLGTTYTFYRWPRVSNPQPGDICTSTYHCGIYIGGGQMIHAPQTGDVVKVSAVQSDMIFVRY